MLGRFVWSPWQLALMAAAGNGPLYVGYWSTGSCCASCSRELCVVCLTVIFLKLKAVAAFKITVMS